MADDWGEAEQSKGFGRGMGFGRGLLAQSTFQSGNTNGTDASTGIKKFGSKGRGGLADKENVNSFESTTKPGFGGGGGRGFGSGGAGFGSRGGGFGSAASQNGNSDAKPSSGGFGGSGGFGSKTSSGGDEWDNSSSDSKPKSFGGGRGGGFGGGRGGGFGGGRGGGGEGNKGCFKCGEEGHMSRECPSADSGGNKSRACFKCGEEGHMSRECPSSGSGDSRPKGCFKCGEEGHMSRECPSADSRPKGCFKCGEEGHMSRECPSADSKPKGCFKCGEEGHMSRECPTGGGSKCFKCGEEGHMSRECPSAEGGSGGGGSRECYKCKEEGHMARDCPNAEASSDDRPPLYIPPAPTEDEGEIFQSMEKGINFDKYDSISVEVSGRDPIGFISSFDEAGLYPSFLRNVKRAKYEKPTPVQKYAIPVIGAGRDLMACAQTGSGKTAAFILPVLTCMMKEGLQSSQFSMIQYPQAIIVAPTRELACQIYMDARKFAYGTDVRPVVLYGGTSVAHQVREVQKGAHLVVGTPGRLKQIIESQKISLEKVKFLVLDEADRMLDMGFEPCIRQMVETMGMPAKKDRQTLMFSATFPEEIQKLAGDFLNDYLFVTVGRVGGANTDVEQNCFEVDRNQKRDKLCAILSETGSDRTLVFVELKRNADFLASYLSQSGFPTTSIHGDRLQREREEALRDFKSGVAPILIATSVAARGLDISGVKHVINYDLPSSIDEYVHRIGRTGRCGNLGKATSFYSHEQDGPLVKSLVRILTEAHQIVPQWLDDYSQTSSGMIDTSSGAFGGRYGGKDIRRDKFKNGNQGGSSGNAWEDSWKGGSNGSQSNAPGGGDDDDEAWD